MKNDQQTKLLAIGILLGLTLTLLLNPGHFSLSYFYETLLGNPHADWGKNFFNLYQTAHSLYPYYEKPTGVYFPLTYILINPLGYFSQINAFWIYLLIFLSLFALSNWTYLVKPIANKEAAKLNISIQTGIILFIFTCLSTPALQIIYSGEVEAYLFLLMVGFLFCFTHKKFYLAVIFLSIAIALKLYPAIFILLFVKEEQYKEILLTLLLSILLILIPLFILKPGPLQNLLFFAQNIGWYHSEYLHTGKGLMNNFSFFALFRFLQTFLGAEINYPVPALWLWGYFIFSVLLLMLAFMYVILVEKKLWKKVFLLVATILLLPHIVFPYKLIYLYLPLYAFIAKDEDKSRLNLCYLLIFILLLAPKHFLSHHAFINSPFFYPVLLTITIAIIVSETAWEKLREP